MSKSDTPTRKNISMYGPKTKLFNETNIEHHDTYCLYWDLGGSVCTCSTSENRSVADPTNEQKLLQELRRIVISWKTGAISSNVAMGQIAAFIKLRA